MSRGKRVISNDRKSRKLKRKRIILIGLEGKNKTEKEYFKHFNGSANDYIIRIAKGNITDPVNMINALKCEIDKMDLNLEVGDKAYCVLDTDDILLKDSQIEEALLLAKEYNIEIIPSSPCFEEWILCHFDSSTKSISNKDIIKEVQKYIKNYHKSMDVYPEICSLTNVAIKNAKLKNKFHQTLGHNLFKIEANPSSQIYKIIEEIKK